VHKGAKIALDDASKANRHMHTVLYGLIKLLMDDVSNRLITSSRFASISPEKSASVSRPSRNKSQAQPYLGNRRQGIAP
jgi:hypothetical protein